MGCHIHVAVIALLENNLDVMANAGILLSIPSVLLGDAVVDNIAGLHQRMFLKLYVFQRLE